MYRILSMFLLAFLATTNSKLVQKILTHKIVGGTKANITNFPYQVSVRYFGTHICGGSFLSPRLVISAAHCFCGNPLHHTIQYGSANINAGKTVEISRIDFHEDFNMNTYENDIALIHLAEDIEFGASAKNIGLASKSPDPGTRAVVSGWGYTNEKYPNELQMVEVQIVDQAVCRKQYANKQNKIRKNMLCAGIDGDGKDACKGDSGGPLVAYNELVGIVSWGYKCGLRNYSGVYADVAKLRPWIDSKINRN